jgi:hypothetical protein
LECWLATFHSGRHQQQRRLYFDRILDALWEMLSGICRRHAIACA